MYLAFIEICVWDLVSSSDWNTDLQTSAVP